jgi:hypothetical protein
MALAAILHRRLVIGAAALSLLAMAGAATTLATTNTQAQSPNDALCAQQDAEPDSAEAEGPDTDNVELECGDQNEQDDGQEAGETAEQGERESDVSPASIPAAGQ